MKNRFYKANGHVGSTLLFWAINDCGYTTNIDQAEIYTREEMQRDVDNGYLRNEDELPLCAESANALAQWRVDCQYIEKTYPEFTDPNDEYVAYLAGKFDGNDLAFANGNCHFDFDYKNAFNYSYFDAEYCIKDASNKLVFVPRYHTDEIARRTFQKQNINRRKMITAAGIVGLRKKRKRQSTGKTRFNCICCGKIIWEFAHPDTSINCCSGSCC